MTLFSTMFISIGAAVASPAWSARFDRAASRDSPLVYPEFDIGPSQFVFVVHDDLTDDLRAGCTALLLLCKATPALPLNKPGPQRRGYSGVRRRCCHAVIKPLGV